MTEPAQAVQTAQASTSRALGLEAAIVRAKMEAMRSFESRLESDPHDSEALERLGMLQFEVGQTHESLTTFERLVEAAPLDPVGRFWLARALDATGRVQDAGIERKIGARLLERPQVRAGAASKPEIALPEPAGLAQTTVARGTIIDLPAEPKTLTTTKTQDLAKPSSGLSFGLEEALLLVASLGILVLFMNILVRI